MPRVTLHHKSVRLLPLPTTGRIRYWDSDTPGLLVLATPTGRVYKVRFKRPNGTKIDFRIGKVDDWALSDARNQADKILKAAASAAPGEDPQQKKLKGRSKDETFGVLAALALESLSLRESTARQWRGIVKNHLVPRFGTRRAAEIHRREIRDFTENLGKTKPVMAARAFEVMRRIFSWGVENEKAGLQATPFTRDLKKPSKVKEADDHERDRCLSRAEVYAIFETLKGRRFVAWDFDRYLRLLFETAVRRDELLKATWSEVDMDAGFFTIRTLRYKSKKPHQVPLTPAAVDELKAIRNQDSAKLLLNALNVELAATTDATERDSLEVRIEAHQKRMRAVALSPYVFPGQDPKKPRSSPQRVFEELRRQVGFEDWVLHDIRRTTSRELSRLGTLPHVRESVLGHSLDKLARTYGAEVPLSDMRKALNKWSERLKEFIRDPPSVAAFPAKEAS